MKTLAPESINSHQVDILYSSDFDTSVICAGTLISSYLVLTVFSCLAGNSKTKLKVRSTHKDVFWNFDTRNVVSIQRQPALNRKSSRNDVAVILLDFGFNLNKSLSFVKLSGPPSEGPELEKELLALSPPFLFGDFLLVKTEESDCEGRVNSICVTFYEPLSFKRPLSRPVIGSGLYCRVKDQEDHFLCGVLALRRGGFLVYTDISKYRHWIRPILDLSAVEPPTLDPKEEDDGDSQEIDYHDYGRESAPKDSNSETDSVAMTTGLLPTSYQLSFGELVEGGGEKQCPGESGMDSEKIISCLRRHQEELKNASLFQDKKILELQKEVKQLKEALLKTEGKGCSHEDVSSSPSFVTFYEDKNLNGLKTRINVSNSCQEIPREWNDKISSLTSTSCVTFYQDETCSDRRQQLVGNHSDLSLYDFDDKISSFEPCERATRREESLLFLTAYEFDNYKGESARLSFDCGCVGYPPDWNDRIDSIKNPQNLCVIGYEHWSCTGKEVQITSDSSSFQSQGMNNKLTTFRICPGTSNCP